MNVRTWLMWAIGSAFLAGCTGACGPDAVDRSVDEREIRALFKESADAGNAGNPKGVAATYTRDGDAWNGQSKAQMHGEIADLEAEWIAMPGYQRWDGKIDSIRFISRDAAIVEISATTILDSGRYDEETTLVVARTGDGWKIAAWRVMKIDPALLRILSGA